MENFALIKTGIDVSDLRALLNKTDLWGTGDLRTDTTEPQHIFLRVNKNVKKNTPAEAVEFYETSVFWQLPEVHPFIFNTFSLMYGTRLGGCLIAKMPPHSSIPEHSDIGPCAYYYDLRLHIVLQAINVDFHCGSETVQMNTGDMWWFDLNQPHSLVNNSDIERIHLIMDIKSACGREKLLKLIKEKCLYARD